MQLPPRPIGPAALALALVLVGAACGSSGSEVDTAAPTSASSTQAAPAPTDGGADDDGGTAPEDTGGTTGTTGEGAEAAPAEETAPADQHLFPDLETVDIADGSTLNLADELVGGDTPVLLWFWAPH